MLTKQTERLLRYLTRMETYIKHEKTIDDTSYHWITNRFINKSLQLTDEEIISSLNELIDNESISVAEATDSGRWYSVKLSTDLPKQREAESPYPDGRAVVLDDEYKKNHCTQNGKCWTDGYIAIFV